MKNQTPVTLFDEKTAAAYDQQAELWAAGREALFSFIYLILAKLPDNARILCVGVGTGTELIALAQTFKQWQFTVIEPAPAMLDICRQKAQESGITSRCTFHEGYLNSLPSSEEFDAATCFLVSHFFTDSKERSNFFNQIASRLRPQGYLISSDLVLGGMSPSAYKSLLEVWVRFRGSESTEEEMEKVRTAWNRHVSALSVPEVEAIIAASGFDAPVLFFQTLFIHAWFSRRTVPN